MKDFVRGLALVAVLSLPMVAQTPDTAQTATRGGRYDSEIKEKLRDKFDNDRFQNVRATVEDSMVTLEGSVRLFAHKINAEEKAKDVDHVNGVRNLITVENKDQISDVQLHQKLADKLRYDRIGYGIVYNALTLDVKDGVVTLKGSVQDEADRASALAIVRNTPGVRGVREDIEVQPTSIFDDELRVRLANRIYNDSALGRYATDPQAPIRIVVKNGHVTLMGVVDREMDKNIAGIRAKEVSGVFSVDNKLVVRGQNPEAAQSKR